MASSVLKGDYPDFTQQGYLKTFKGESIYICHGTRDANAPYHFIDQTVSGLKLNGANVTFMPVNNGGHGIPKNIEVRDAFFDWISKTIGQNLKK